jgi:UDP-N-acetylmuramoyl-tripeptide--D-alanyl-D-alanine ligase
VITSLADREKLWGSSPGDFWTLDRISVALGVGAGGPRGTRSISAVSTDTRVLGPGELFVALTGENHDGHEFLRAAVEKGAAAVVVARPERTAGLGVPVFIVADTLVALGQLAGYRRRAWGAGRVVVGLTGTNGKTSTKDLTAAALASRVEVHATHGNLNNRIGLPLTILSLPDAADVAVFEMGTSLPGEIALLRAIAEPQVAIVTSVAEGHLEGLGTLEGVLAEKTSIYSGVAVAIAPASQPEIAQRAVRLTSGKVITCGLGQGELAANRWGSNEDGSGWLEVEGVRVAVPLRGEHNLRNAMLALAAARELGVSLEDAARGIAGLTPGSMRLESTPLGGGETTLINDAYNSNPGSALAAIEYLTSLQSVGQKVIVLGSMRELGAMSAQLHDRVAAAALNSNLDVVAGIGEFAQALARSSPRGDPRVVTAPDVEELWEKLRLRLERRSTILLKASRGVKLERIIPHLREWADQ